MKFRSFIWGFALALLGARAGANPIDRAEVGRESIRLVYVAPPECPGRIDFARVLVEKVPAFVDAGDEGARTFEVRVVRDGRVFQAEMAIRDRDGTEFARRVAMEDCDQAVRAVALIIALSVDPQARAADKRSAPSPKRETAPNPNIGKAPGETVRPTLSSKSSRFGIAFGGDAEELLLISNHPVLALGLHVQVDRPRGFALRASLRRSVTQQVSSGSIGGEFRWTWARIDGCPVRFGGAVVDARPCVFVDLGEIDAAGFGGAASSTRGRIWLLAGVLARVAVHEGPFAGTLDLGLGRSINRESFEFVPSTVVYRIPAWVPYVGLSLGARFSL